MDTTARAKISHKLNRTQKILSQHAAPADNNQYSEATIFW